MTKYNFPKFDLHLHLDGSFRIETLWELAMERGVKMPGATIEEYKDFLFRCSNAKDVNEYLKMFAEPTIVMSDFAAISRITYELIADLAKDGIYYAEIRFAPQLHTGKGMSQAEAIEAVLDGRKRALADYPQIKIGIICCMMSIGPETLNWDANLETIKETAKYLGQGVVAIDLAGAEGIVPLSNFGPLFTKAKELNIPIICHAGDSQGPETVKDALDFGVKRIGHGHHIILDPDLCALARERQVALEICPTSNIQCHTQPSYALHPAKQLLDLGIPVTINTDNMTLARVNIDSEYDHCLLEMGFSYYDLIQMNINSARHSFLSDKEKEEVINKLESYRGIELC